MLAGAFTYGTYGGLGTAKAIAPNWILIISHEGVQNYTSLQFGFPLSGTIHISFDV
jgi:hypothetical protein